MKKFQITVFGLGEDQLHPEIKALTPTIDFRKYDMDTIMDPIEPQPDVILCFSPDDAIAPLELAQALRMNYQELPIFFLTGDKKVFDKKRLIKNGFNQAFLLPWEKVDVIRAMQTEAIYSATPELRNYKPIKVIDLIPGAVLDFSLKVYLPMANRLLQFSFNGDPIPEEKFRKLAESSANTLFIHESEVDKFRSYTATTLKAVMGPNSMSATEKQDKLENCVRDLISDMFIDDIKENTFGKSQALLEEIKGVIKIILMGDHNDYYKKLASMVNQESTFYQHLSNVSTYAALFAMILGFDKPSNMALAGLMHDVGMINVPGDVVELDRASMSATAVEAYEKHPDQALEVARLKRMVLPADVMKAISQHHECMNGSGYPNKLTSERICKEARLLAIADEFDYLTSTKPGYKALTPAEALEKMYKDNCCDLGQMKLDFDFLKSLKKSLIKETL